MDRKLNPTLVIFFACFITFATTLGVGFIYAPLSLSLTLVLFFVQTLCVFLIFTPLHDATHYVASKNRKLNEMVVWGTWPIFINSTYLFRKIHLSHHAKTNQGEADPDHFTAHPKLVMRWVKSFLLVFYYYYYSVKNYGRNFKEWAIMIASTASLLGLTIASIWGPYASVFLSLWLLPSLTGIGILGFANTSWPHHPAQEIERTRNTRVLLVPRFVQWLMFNQNYHLVHHLKPNLPWYDYPRYWSENGERLQAQGAVVSDFRVRNWLLTHESSSST